MAGKNVMNAHLELGLCRNFYELVHTGEKLLSLAGCPESGADARLLLFFVMGWDLSEYALHGSSPCSPEKREVYADLIERRMRREPVQYIMGYTAFYGYDFYVTPDVLIPRFDTETLVEAVLPCVKNGDRILDMCTGSGCIPIVLYLELTRSGRHVTITASDISEAALLVAEKNAARLGAEITILKSDLFERIQGSYDIITVNPPYIETEIIGTLDPEVRLYEPNLALDGCEDGLFFYRKIVEEAGRYLAPGGLLALEIGADQSSAVEALMRDALFGDVRTVRDLAGNDRCVLGKLK